MKRPDSVQCKNCMFLSPSNDGDIICVFNPPMMTASGAATWVAVKKHWWCGQFRPADNLTAIEWVAWQKGLIEDAKMQK